MAYVNGSATSFADLLAAIQSACTANGWTLTGSVLSKGTCFAKLTVVDSAVDLLGGTGLSGSTLTGGAGYSCRLQAVGANPIVFPATYEVHINSAPDEVYVIVNYSITRYGWLAFGQSPVAGLPGTGNWQAAICSASNGSTGIDIAPAGAGVGGSAPTTPAALGFLVGTPSGNPSNYGDPQNFRFHHGLDGNQWSSVGNAVGSVAAEAGGWVDGPSQAVIAPALAPLLAREPNTWNGEVALLPMQPCIYRASSKVSMVGDFGHARLLRIDNYAPGDLITLGTDKWKVYPWHMKNTTVRDGGSSLDHTGTLGWAVRYTGP
jgi:hypothetical protein